MNISVVVPNWNGKDSVGKCLDSLLSQSIKTSVVVVENGSTDGSLEYLTKNYPEVELVINEKNLGFAGGVNSGIKKAIDNESDYIALFNNDALADKDWLKNIVSVMEQHKELGIATCKFVDINKKKLDSTGDLYTSWGLPYPRGRGEEDLDKYDHQTEIFAASGGASVYRTEMLKQIGLFDEDFFAYYEDIDISFRAQLAGWKVAYVPEAVAYHQIGGTSQKIKGFTTYQTIKNLPWLLVKNVPGKTFFKVLPRFTIAYLSFIFSALTRGQIMPVLKGLFMTTVLLPKKFIERSRIQSNRKVSVEYIDSMLVHDLPPNAYRLRKLRRAFTGK